MIKDLSLAATSISHPLLNDWKNQGKKILGYTCSFLPTEILYAAGFMPYRLRGIETQSLDIGDSYYGPFICSFPKCILQLAGEGKFNFIDGVIITPGCDSMRRLDECFRKAGEDYPGIVPPFFYYFNVPHKAAPHGINWFVEEIQKLITSLEKHFEIKISEENLKNAIKIYNKGRRLLKEIEELRAGGLINLSGTDAFTIAIANTVLPRDELNQMFEQLLIEFAEQTIYISDKKRLMVVGSVSDDISLVKLIEDSGALVVAENLCFGVRNETDEVDENDDPIRSLSQRYLSHSICPRMFGGYNKRLEILKEKINKARVEGVILQNVRFCDLHGSENGIFERDLEAIGIPCLRLEREYGSLSGKGRLKMRIDAFIESIS